MHQRDVDFHAPPTVRPTCSLHRCSHGNILPFIFLSHPIIALPMQPEYITTAEAAARLNYTIQHVRRLAREGKIRGRKMGRDWLLVKDAVEQHAIRDEILDLPLEPVGGREESGT